MTIPKFTPVAEYSDRLSNLEHCAQHAPKGAYEEAKRAVECMDEAIEGVRRTLREHGFKADGNDMCRTLESVIYWFLTESNPEKLGLITGEGFGEHLQGPAGERVMANTIRDMECLRRLGVVA